MIDLKLGYDRKKFTNFLNHFLPDDTIFFQESKTIQSKSIHFNEVNIIGKSKSLNNLHIIEFYKKKNNNGRLVITKNIFDILKSNNIKYALIITTTKKLKQYRISYIFSDIQWVSENKVKRIFSNYKRRSFLLGSNKIHTAKKQLIDKGPINNTEELKSRFDIEVVTEEFFQSYKRLYEQLVVDLEKDSEFKKFAKKNHIDINLFAKKILSQVIFCYFLQKMKLLGATRNEKLNFGLEGFLRINFDKNCHLNKNFYNDFLEYLFYKGFNKDNSNNENFVNDLGFKVPYLNGDLFEPPSQYSWEKEFLEIPNKIFSNKKENGILDVFDLYNFTVDEYESSDTEIAVDPEMLGKVFEKLLNEKERKKGGAHYTPREVVAYMCRQSIFYYLNNHLKDNFSQQDYSNLLNYVENFNNDLIKTFADTKLFLLIDDIDNLLKIIKICDPAIGSGAFPVFLMSEIVKIRIFIKKITNKKFSVNLMKRNFIENSLYGVDIDSGAVEITKLRLWLSLIIEEKNHNKISTLPNLDYKIMQGNSLVEKAFGTDFSFKKEVTLFDFQTDAISSSLLVLLDEYYNTSVKVIKDELKIQIKNLFLELITSSISLSGKKISQEELKKIKNESINIFDENKPRNFFLWNIFFHEVFKKKGGFDLIIANPPYIKEYTNKNAFSEIKEHEYYQGKMDIWYFMACKSIDLLKDKGVLCYIAQNNWFTNSGAKKLRSKVINDCQILEINDFSNYMIFDNADQQTMILVLLKNRIENYEFKYSKVVSKNFIKQDLINFFKNKQDDKMINEKIRFNKKKYQNKYLVFSNSRLSNLLDKIENQRNFNLNKNEMSQGIVGPQEKLKSSIWRDKLNESEDYKPGEGIFLLNKNELADLNLSEDELKFIKPCLLTESLEKYYTNTKIKHYIIYTGKEFNDVVSNYPRIKKHLDRFKQIITSDNKPYGLHRRRDEFFFKEKKILCIRKCEDPFFCLIENDSYVFAKFNIIKSSRINLEYLTILLNSKLTKFYLKNRGKMQGFNFQLDTEPLLSIPVKVPENYEKYHSIFKNIKDQKMNINEVKKESDKLIYKLYNLSKDDVAEIENDLSS